MTDIAHGPNTNQRDRIVFAVILIAVGVGALVLQYVETRPGAGGWVVLLIGLALVGAFLYTHQYGYLIPGGIMTGLGAGIVVSESVAMTDEASGGAVVLGLGLGFVSIWAIGSLMRLTERHWWPLIPGGILSVVGSALLIGGQAVDMLDYWGVILVVIGLIVIGRVWFESRRPV